MQFGSPAHLANFNPRPCSTLNMQMCSIRLVYQLLSKHVTCTAIRCITGDVALVRPKRSDRRCLETSHGALGGIRTHFDGAGQGPGPALSCKNDMTRHHGDDARIKKLW